MQQAEQLQNEQDRLIKAAYDFHQPFKNSQNSILFLSELTQVIPQGIYLTQILKKTNLIYLTGYADNNKPISIFSNKVNKISLVQQVTLSHIKQDKKNPSYHFVLQITLHQDNQSGETYAH